MSKPSRPQYLFFDADNPLLAWDTEQLQAEIDRRREATERANEGSRRAARAFAITEDDA